MQYIKLLILALQTITQIGSIGLKRPNSLTQAKSHFCSKKGKKKPILSVN